MTTSTTLEKAAALPEPVARRGITEWQWRTLMNSLYPGAKGESVLLVWDYCLSRNLDPMKRPCHIVPLEVKVGERYEWRDVVMPGVYEHRTTAQRTGEYLGHSKPEYGPEIDVAGITAPAWCEMTMYRWNAKVGQRAEFPVRVLFEEVVATKRDGKANARWTKAKVQMLTKCTEAAGLREAFPDECGGQVVEEEMDGQRAIAVAQAPVVVAPSLPKPADFDLWLMDLEQVADEGTKLLAEAWNNSPKATRQYLMATDAASWDALKVRAANAEAAKLAAAAEPTKESQG
jgi:phage recombination protein Bet